MNQLKSYNKSFKHFVVSDPFRSTAELNRYQSVVRGKSLLEKAIHREVLLAQLMVLKAYGWPLNSRVDLLTNDSGSVEIRVKRACYSQTLNVECKINALDVEGVPQLFVAFRLGDMIEILGLLKAGYVLFSVFRSSTDRNVVVIGGYDGTADNNTRVVLFPIELRKI